MTLFDRITLSTPKATFADRVRMNNLAAAVVMTSQGIPFIHAGEELLRSKPLEDGTFDHNSYRSPDAVNNLKWADLSKEEYQQTIAYYSGLIAFRQAHPALRMMTAQEVSEKITKLTGLDFNVVGFHIAAGANGENNELIVIFNPNAAATTVALPEGEWSAMRFTAARRILRCSMALQICLTTSTIPMLTALPGFCCIDFGRM